MCSMSASGRKEGLEGPRSETVQKGGGGDDNDVNGMKSSIPLETLVVRVFLPWTEEEEGPLASAPAAYVIA